MSDAPDGAHRRISVVIPCVRAPDVAATVLASLARQTLPAQQWEVILVVNGEMSARRAQFHDLRQRFPHLDIRIITLPEPNTVTARFAGIRAARYPWVTVVDDDDEVSAGYLAGMHACARPGVVVLAPVHDRHPDGTVDTGTELQRIIGPFAGRTVDVRRCPAALRFGVGKLIPTSWARELHLPEHLHRGSDVSFYSALYAAFTFQLSVVPADADCVYLRWLTANSVSRADLDLEAMAQLLDVARHQQVIIDGAPAARRPVLRRRLYGVTQMVHTYARRHPQARAELGDLIAHRGLTRTAGLRMPGRFGRLRRARQRLLTRGVGRG